MPSYPEPVNISGLKGILTYANTATKGIFGSLIPLTLWLGTFLYLLNRGYSPSECAVTAGFFTAFVSVFLRIMGVINDFTMALTAFSLVVPVLWLYFAEKR